MINDELLLLRKDYTDMVGAYQSYGDEALDYESILFYDSGSRYYKYLISKIDEMIEDNT